MMDAKRMISWIGAAWLVGLMGLAPLFAEQKSEEEKSAPSGEETPNPFKKDANAAASKMLFDAALSNYAEKAIKQNLEASAETCQKIVFVLKKFVEAWPRTAEASVATREAVAALEKIRGRRDSHPMVVQQVIPALEMLVEDTGLTPQAHLAARSDLIQLYLLSQNQKFLEPLMTQIQDGLKETVSSDEEDAKFREGACQAMMLIGLYEPLQAVAEQGTKRFTASPKERAIFYTYRYVALVGNGEIKPLFDLAAEIDGLANKDEPLEPIRLASMAFAAAGDENGKVELEKTLKILKEKYPEHLATKIFKTERDFLTHTAIGVTPWTIQGTAVSGVAVDMDQYKGKVILVDFWATWCPPCREELPFLKKASEDFAKEGLIIIGVTNGGRQKKEQVKQFLDKAEIHYETIWDERSELFQQWRIRGIPSNFLIGRDGRIVAKNLRGKAVEEAVRAALAAPVPGEEKSAPPNPIADEKTLEEDLPPGSTNDLDKGFQ